MTGYSRTTRAVPRGTVTVELRSTNHRYLEVESRLPDGFSGMEQELLRALRRHIRRGRVDVSVNLRVTMDATPRVVVNESLAAAYYQRLLELQTRFSLKGRVTLDQLLSLPGLFAVADERNAPEPAWPHVRAAFQDATTTLLRMRRQEGGRLVRDIRTHAAAIRRHTAAIRRQLPKRTAQQRARWAQRVSALMGTREAAVMQQIKEAVALAKESDIHEELVRLDSHLAQLQQALAGHQPVGKKLDFLAQEMMREVNTLGAKANDARITRCVIEIKEAVEKIREQAQNLE